MEPQQEVSPYRTLRAIFTVLCALLLLAGVIVPPTVALVHFVARQEQEARATHTPPNFIGPLAPIRPGPARPAAIRTPEITVPERHYKIIPIEPSSGGSDHYALTVQECHREGEVINCVAKATNNTDASTTMRFEFGNVVDDEGNAYHAHVYETMDSFKLLPGVPTNVPFQIQDPHLNVKKVNIEINLEWHGYVLDGSRITFKDIPVQ